MHVPNRCRPVIERLWKRTARGAPSPLPSVNPFVRDRQRRTGNQDYCRPWRFNPGEIETPVCLWHGDLDTIVPCAMTRHLAARIPQCRAAFFPEDGHFSLLIGRRDEILARLRRLDEPRHGDRRWTKDRRGLPR